MIRTALRLAAILSALEIARALRIRSFENPERPKNAEAPAQEKRERAENDQSAKIAALLNSVVNENKADREQQERHDAKKRFREWMTIAFIFFSGIAAFIQARVLVIQSKSFKRQVTLMRDQLAEMQKAYGPLKVQADAASDAASAAKASAEAAKQTVDTTMELERPRLIINSANLVQLNGPKDPNPHVSYTIANIGKSPANVLRLYTECLIDTVLPKQPTYKIGKYRNVSFVSVPNNIISSGPPGVPNCEFDQPLTEADYESIAGGRKYIIFKVIIGYESALDVSYMFGTAMQIKIGEGRTGVWGAKSYNYDRKIPGGFDQGPTYPPKIIP